MAKYTPTGDVSAQTSVLAGSSPASFSVPIAPGTGALAASAVDNGAIYNGYMFQVVGNASVSAGAVKLQGSLDNATWYDLTAAVTIPTSATSSVVQGFPTAGQQTTSTNITASRFMRINVTTNTAGATSLVYYGGV